jgi:acyl-CoA thioester hydrolase
MQEPVEVHRGSGASVEGGIAVHSLVKRLQDPVHFVSRHRARFHELDPFGHMNTNHYLAYFTENRFIGHRDFLHLDLKALARFPIEPHIRKVELEFIRPVLADDEFTVESYLSEVGETDCLVWATMTSATGKLLATCKFYIVCVDKKTRKAIEWPENFIRLFFHRVAPE